MTNRAAAANACVALAVIAGLLVFLAGSAWNRAHPYGTFWDEAGYFNQASSDYFAVKDTLPIKRRIEILVKSGIGQPPSHRAVLALTYFTGPRPALLRGVSLAMLLVTALTIFLAVSRLGGRAAGALAALAILVSPSILASSIRFGTEFPLYFALAGTLYFLFASWGRKTPALAAQIGLGLTLGLGFWSKASFITVALPMVAVAYALSYRRDFDGPPPRWFLRPILAGIGIGAIFWVPLGSRTLESTAASVGDRHSLGTPSIATLGKFVSELVSTGTGPVLATLLGCAALALALALGRRRFEGERAPLYLAAIAVCIAGCIPFPLVEFFSGGHDVRYFSPVVIPLAVAFAFVVAGLRGPSFVVASVVAGLALVVQLGTILAPIATQTPAQRFDTFERDALVGNYGNGMASVFAPRAQWDWEPLRTLCLRHRVSEPLISYLGNGETFNSMQMAYPWRKADEPVVMHWLWRYENGALNWQALLSDADRSDVVLTIPGYRGLNADKQPRDNVYNAAFAKKLESDPHFNAPIIFRFRGLGPANVQVFVNKEAGKLPRPASFTSLGAA